jgi:hypothetical protein
MDARVIGREWMIEAIRMSGGDIVAVMSTNPARGRACADEFGIATAAGSPPELFSSGVESVYVATTNDRHRAEAIVAADAGVHVLCEKPLATTPHHDTIASSPKVVGGFVRASIKAYAYALQHPQEALASLIKRSPSLKPEVEVAKLKATTRPLESADTEANGVGYSSKARWKAAQVLRKDYGGPTKTETEPDVSVYFTNDFFPKR